MAPNSQSTQGSIFKRAKRQLSTRLLPTAVLFGSVAFGMQIAISQIAVVQIAKGQVGAPLTRPTLGTKPAEPPPAAPASAPAPATQSAPTTPTLMDVQRNQRDQRSATQGATLGSESGVKPYVAPTQYSPPPPGGTQPTNQNAGSKEFVPSEVETFIASPLKMSDPRVILHTSMGDIKIRLFASQVPNSVRNFLALAQGEKEFTDVKSGQKTIRPFYDGLTFHKVVNGQYIQTGCPFGTGRGGPGYILPDETTEGLTFNKPGRVAMAPQRDGTKNNKDSNGSQFFITLDSMPQWDGQYTIIGEVETGLSVVKKIGSVDVGPTNRPIRRVHLRGIETLP